MLHDLLRIAVRDRLFEPGRPLSLLARGEAGRVVVPASVSPLPGSIALLAVLDGASRLVVMTGAEPVLDAFDGETVSIREAGRLWHALACPLDHRNATALRAALPRTAPSIPAGPRSFGFGDRIGGDVSATPWHLAVAEGYDLLPVPAQQSVRELARTGRTFAAVLDDATWAVFRTGWARPWAADADHLKSLDNLETAARAGFTFFTIDPSDVIDREAPDAPDDVLAAKLAALATEREVSALLARYGGHDADERSVVRSLAAYLPAIRFGIEAYRRLEEVLGEGGFAFEFSVDETEHPTSALDHRIVAGEFARAEVALYSLAPRFVGLFEKGIDYIGDPEEFRRSLEEHAALAIEFGGYRLSLHSGSDKFAVYPIFGEVTEGRFHVKTAGTSFLEAVKTAAAADIDRAANLRLRISLRQFRQPRRAHRACNDAVTQRQQVQFAALSQDATRVLQVRPVRLRRRELALRHLCLNLRDLRQ